jgi:hypothetical protein
MGCHTTRQVRADMCVNGCLRSKSLLEGTDRHMSLCFAGTPAPLLNDISMQLPANSMGLIYGSSGSVSGCDWQISSMLHA